MSFDVFNYRSENEELKDMFKQLSVDNYAISTIDYDTIAHYALAHKINVKFRNLKDGRVKVRLLV